MDIGMIISIGLSLSISIYLGIVNQIERKRAAKRESELLNRLMSRDFTNYVTGETALLEAEKETDGTPVDGDVFPMY